MPSPGRTTGKEPVGFRVRRLALGLGAITWLIVVGMSLLVFESWAPGAVVGVAVGYAVSWFVVREARIAHGDADPETAARRGSWEPPHR